MKTIAQLKREIAKIQALLDQRRANELNAECSKMVGKHFVLNEPSIRIKPDNFLRVDSASGGKLTTFYFGENEFGYLHIGRIEKDNFDPKQFEMMYEQTTKAKFDKAFNTFKSKVNHLLKASPCTK